MKGMKKRHYFFLNPYHDCAFTRCPKCEDKTRIRKFPLVIHVDPRQMLLVNKQCKYCLSCDLIIARKTELEHQLATALSQTNCEIVANDYVVMGTIDREDWREGNKRQIEPTETIERIYVFKDVWKFEVVPPGWYPEGK
jgi:hypothetical protein